MSLTARRCWKCLKLNEFPSKSVGHIPRNEDDVVFMRRPNIFCRNVNKECFDRIQSVIDQTRYIVYLLSELNWKNDVWQRSASLLILSECSLIENHSDEILKVSSDRIDAETLVSVFELMEISYAEENPIPATSEILLSLKPTDTAYTEKWDGLAKLLTDEIKARVDVVSSGNNEHSFSFSDYLSALNDNTKLGRNVFWADVLPSSFTIGKSILPKLPKQSGLVLISAVQTAGIGRGNNQWISPRGMACFTLHFDLPLLVSEPSCELSQVLTWIQHLSSIAVVQTLNELLYQYSNGNELYVEMKIKWPNDVYAIDKKTNIGSKIAGVMSTASLSDTTKAKCLLGIGINVANLFPTTCLHEIIQRCYANKNVEMPSVATVIGRTICHLENLIGQLERGDMKDIKKLYTQSWMHSGQRIKAMCKDEFVECAILGVDDFGYLKAMTVENGESVTLLPDGNLIDMASRTVISRKD
ncbi:unnamed protein product [Hymenolepis diminuta]|uniref:BPL/LPL catalytic domain-containing protein n=1 Tax=Hymenolepis diminuta TaxID=6216 RepID=A0A0R3SHT4_HYMDI|nr:unnamed protein product [Hymenolepis diminuta]